LQTDKFIGGATNSKETVLDLSVVIPLYNEKAALEELKNKLVEAINQLNLNYEVIFVDDGSSDGSCEILKKLHENDDHVKVIQFRKNHGKAAALAAGFERASGKVIVTMDADLQDDPNEIKNLLGKLNQGYDLVSGWKKRRYDPLSKRLPSKIFNCVVSWVSGIRLHDFNCGLKGYRCEVAKTIDLYGEFHRFTPVLAHWEGFRVTEIAVQHHPRKYGSSKYGLARFTHGFLDLITILFLLKFKKRPLHLFGIAGLLFFLGGIGISLYLTFERLFAQKYLSNRPLLFLGVLLIIIGIQFVSIGLLGEMITETQKSRQGISLKAEIGFD